MKTWLLHKNNVSDIDQYSVYHMDMGQKTKCYSQQSILIEEDQKEGLQRDGKTEK